MERFRHYLRTIWNCYETEFELLPLITANPMGKEHVTVLLDELLALGAEQVAADVNQEIQDKKDAGGADEDFGADR